MYKIVTLIRNKIAYEICKTNQKVCVFVNGILVKNICRKPVVETIDETIDRLIRGASISRYGDGEFDTICGRTLRTQKKDKRLAKRLKYILKKNCKYDDFLVGIPYVFGDLNIFIDDAKKHWEMRLNKKRYKWYLLLNRKKPYSNSQITRFYFDWKDKSKCRLWADKLKKIWDDREIVIIEGDRSRLGVGNDLFSNAKTIERILCPTENAFDVYDDILKVALQQDKKKLIIIALGATATLLAYDLYLEGFQAIDIGNIDIEYEWMKQNAQKKIAIEGKYVNEAWNGHIVKDIENKEYSDQIIEIVK